MSRASALPASIGLATVRRPWRAATAALVALLLMLAAVSVILYVQGMRQERLLEHQRATERLLDAAITLAAAQRLSTLPDEPDAQAWAELRTALDRAGLEMLEGPARWTPGLANVAGGLRLASLAPGPAFGETAWVALYDAHVALDAALPETSALRRYLDHAALVLAVLWSFAAVAAFVLGHRGRAGGARPGQTASELDHRLVQRLLMGLPGGAASCGAIVLRLENLDLIADRHGRAAACATMEKIARALQPAVRRDDVLARASDDSFVILLTEATPAVLRGAVERLRNIAASQPPPFRDADEAQLHIVAAAARGRPGEALDALIERARAKLSAPLAVD